MKNARFLLTNAEELRQPAPDAVSAELAGDGGVKRGHPNGTAVGEDF